MSSGVHMQAPGKGSTRGGCPPANGRTGVPVEGPGALPAGLLSRPGPVDGRQRQEEETSLQDVVRGVGSKKRRMDQLATLHMLVRESALRIGGKTFCFHEAC